MVIECDSCGVMVEAKEVGYYIQETEWDWVQNIKFSLCSCSQCASPLLVRQKFNFDDKINDLKWGTPEKIYPDNLFHINPIIPKELETALLECIQCYRSKSYTATVIMCRRAIEGFCFIKGAQDRNLNRAISKLRDEGVINDELYEWANMLRLVGNEAAHNIHNSFEAIDAKDILDFTILKGQEPITKTVAKTARRNTPPPTGEDLARLN